eukprot:COSAG06_NODE_772_length_12432_cov_119.880159_2_plen_69_part_00
MAFCAGLPTKEYSDICELVAESKTINYTLRLSALLSAVCCWLLCAMCFVLCAGCCMLPTACWLLPAVY